MVLLTPDEGPSLETSIFPLSFQVVRESFYLSRILYNLNIRTNFFYNKHRKFMVPTINYACSKAIVIFSEIF